ncbi:unnamed protein product [Clavelina lepadiformis]|uniref:Phospholipid/glycerol acyltransferase domain-containing protein n=1 Tax=Clavelina lepadiformis TaxID=159417 RepID=A0ABP0G7Q4_CLALP
MIGMLKSSILGRFMLAYTFMAAGAIINVIQLLAVPLAWVGFKNQSRNLVRRLTYLHWALIPAISQWWANIDITLHARPDDMTKFGKEKALLVMNHKCQLDWVVIWCLGHYYDVLQNVKAIVKSSLRVVPVIGWAMWFNEFIFVRRNAKTDGGIIIKSLDNFSSFRYDYWLLIFCEGTRFTPDKQKTSNEFAVKNGLRPLKHHLVPRTKGFSLISRGLRDTVPAVYDVTLCFPGNKDPTLSDFVGGRDVKVDLIIRRIPIEEVPEEPEKCSEFLHEIYRDKDQLCEFHQNHQRFPIMGELPAYEGCVKKRLEKNKSALFVIILWMVLLVPPFVALSLFMLFSGTLMQSIVSSLVIVAST